MHAKWKFALSLSALLTTHAFAIPNWYGFHPLVSVLAGISILQTQHSQSYIGTDDGVFTYRNRNHSETAGLAGIYVAMEKQLAQPHCLLQTGLELLHIGEATFRGFHLAGNEPETSTAYHYQYRLHAQQLLVVTKLLKTYRQIYHPYVSLGLGASFNHQSNFNALSYETGSINLTPTFSANTHTAFAYQLGLGVDTNLSEHVRMGIGYQFSNLGRATFKNGRVIFNNYSFPSPFNLAIDNNYSNQFIAQLTYLA